jgi:DNA-binding winged helix-turn-helix (wHTH) protein/tetratricopeptide (TPR) repeat protein
MFNKFSNQNQSSIESSFRFGEFGLNPDDRTFKKSGRPVSLPPKAFDALLCLVRRAGHLVSKQELVKTLWTDVYVSERNLTNIVVTLRKVVGSESIRTVSKYGYRFDIPVVGEPGVGRATFERFARARDLTAQRSLESMQLARDLYWTCLAEAPAFAPAWAWLGRSCWFLGKFGANTSANSELSRAAFQRSFALDPDLACAHQFYTLVQVDSGHAAAAMNRLLDRLKAHPGEPESLAGLVHALRFRGLIDISLESHQRAVALDPAIVTSVPHTLFLAGDYGSAIETYGGKGAYYLDAAAWAALGDPMRAIAMLRERLAKSTLSRLMTDLMWSLLALLEGRQDESVQRMDQADTSLDPEILIYFARHYSQIGHAQAAIRALRNAAESGFLCPPETLNGDPWFAAVRTHPEFSSLLTVIVRQVEIARHEFDKHGGIAQFRTR